MNWSRNSCFQAKTLGASKHISTTQLLHVAKSQITEIFGSFLPDLLTYSLHWGENLRGLNLWVWFRLSFLLIYFGKANKSIFTQKRRWRAFSPHFPPFNVNAPIQKVAVHLSILFLPDLYVLFLYFGFSLPKPYFSAFLLFKSISNNKQLTKASV